MSLRKSPVRSATLLAACRANSHKSTGPRTPAGKARVALNALRHGRRAPALARLLPCGLSFEDRLLYNWIFRAIRNSFLTQNGQPGSPGGIRQGREVREVKIRRVALQIWCRVRDDLARKSDDQSAYVTDYSPLNYEHKLAGPIAFRLERSHPNGLLTFRTHSWGRNPRRPVRQTSQTGANPAAEERPRVRTVRALWRGDCTVEDWDPEPLPDPDTDPAGFYHWRRDIQRQYRALRRAQARQAREERREQDLEPLADWLFELRAAWEGARLPALPGLTPPAQKSYTKALDNTVAE